MNPVIICPWQTVDEDRNAGEKINITYQISIKSECLEVAGQATKCRNPNFIVLILSESPQFSGRAEIPDSWIHFNGPFGIL